MQRDSKYPLLMKSSQAKEGIYQEILAEDAGWEFLNFNARILKKGQVWKGFTGENEYGIILLSGDYSV
ncbi:5-deoxy-glucuronate isomerase, partial [Cyclobacteriaceae bacterium]|nr:5-deoxy-glucuronate isomerase [Cyclobacteriaceae bacterium]